MTDKIKEAREAIEDTKQRISSLKKWRVRALGAKLYIDNRLPILETILKALSAYEKLQGVDLDTVKEIEERWGDRFLELEEPVPEGMKRMGYVVDIHFLLTQLKSARLVADIGGK